MFKKYDRYRKNLLKVLSLVLAIFVWIYVLNSERLKFEKTIKLEYRLKDQVIFAQKPIQEVTFVLEGPRAFMRSLIEREDTILVDLSYKNPQFKRGQYTLREADLSLPYGVKVDRIIPRRLNLQLDKKLTKTLPIKLQLLGDLPEPLFLKELVVEPPELQIDGPKALMVMIHDIQTKPIQRTQLMEKSLIPLELIQLDTRLSILDSASVTLYGNIQAQRSNQKLSKVFPRLMGEGQLVDPRQSFELDLWVMPAQLIHWKKWSKEIQLVIRTPETNPNPGKPISLAPIVSLPRGVYLKQIKPETALVNLP
jgi:YbbR domain-containing protein